MKPIPVTQYLRPVGRAIEARLVRPDEVAAVAVSIIQAGHRFELEQLRTGEFSVSVCDAHDDLDIEICGSAVNDINAAFDRLVTRFADQLQRQAS